MKPCIPPELKEQAAAAEKRKQEALDRLIDKTGAVAPDENDPFIRELERLIDADKNVVRMIDKRKAQ